jgi:uncharacterized protein YcaQ
VGPYRHGQPRATRFLQLCVRCSGVWWETAASRALMLNAFRPSKCALAHRRRKDGSYSRRP